MKITSISLLSYFFLLILCCFSWPTSALTHDSIEGFVECLSLHSQNHASISNVIYTPKNASYASVLNSTIYNLRFTSPSTPKPLAIITPLYEYQIQPIIYCSKEHGLQIRVRSGGHDFEGVSYTSPVPFVVIDLINLRLVDVDIATNTAWVQSGATIGELYEKIAEKSRTVGFPGAICTTVGIGGYLSGGGYGAMVRKYGLAADHVIDARLIDANGKILDRKSMGEDLFWAIRGGGGGSFGVVLAWKLKLLPVPETVTVFTVPKTLEQNATQIVHRWQFVVPKFHEDLFMGILMSKANSSRSGGRTIQATFLALFLGGTDRLLPLMRENFPELGLVKEDCMEMSWNESTWYLGSRALSLPRHSKSKSDFAKEPIPITAIEGIWRVLFQEEADTTVLFSPYGGRMEEISESALPFPHRAGILFLIDYSVFWDEEDATTSQRHINWVRSLYKYMTPYVSKNPREAYINYRDLDLGVNNEVGKTSYAQASIWGSKYFKNNFHRLAKVKTMIDPSNFFRHEQSIPVI